MSVLLRTRADITLDALRRVSWAGESVEIAPPALELMDRCHEAFQTLVDVRLAQDATAMVYGVTTAPGDGGLANLTAEQLERRPTRIWTAASFGEALPERVVRGIVLARLANFLGGHAAVRAEVGRAVAAMLDGGELPRVPAQGNGGSGEILALGHLFYDLSARLTLQPRERMALINGSPCSAALVGDVALAAHGRTRLAEQVFALSTEAVAAPLEAYSSDLEPLWGDEHETAALRSLRSLLDGHHPERQRHQAPVSFRILPRVLGQVRRAGAEAERAAAVSLRSVTDNPVYVPADEGRPLGTVLSTGGYHNPQAVAAIDGVSFAWADLCQLAERHTDKLFLHPATAPHVDQEWSYKPLHMVQNAWAEEARLLAHPTLLSLGGFGQNDVPALAFLAWRKAMAIGRCLDAALAVLAAIAAHALDAGGRPTPAALSELAQEVRAVFAPVADVRRLGPDCDALTAAFARRVFQGRVAGRDAQAGAAPLLDL
ncbi:MAG TPA: aromatic amino acid lyase [Candidatus Dormibacteraeota bacterium]|nr:aromatic amino acid lyase [Candidatus Dormibacteraeota bacterium]